MENSINIKQMGYLDLKSYINVLNYLNDDTNNLISEVYEIGFNKNSGYIYAYLENSISVCSCLGHKVEFLVTNFENGEEYFFDEYDEAINKLNDLQNEN